MAINIDLFKKRRESAGRSNTFQLKDGDNFVRFVPRSAAYFEDNDLDIAYPIKVHYQVHPENKYLICPRTASIGKPCPICERVNELYDSKIPENESLAGIIRAKKRAYFNIVGLSSPNPENTPADQIKIMPFECGDTLYSELVDAFFEDPENDFLRLKEGYIFNIKKETVGGYPRYKLKNLRKPFDLTPYLSDNYIEEIDSLKNQIDEVKSYEDLEEIYENGLELREKKANRSVYAKPAPAPAPAPTPRRATKPAPKPEPVAEVEQEAEVEAPAATPKKATKAKSGAKKECFGKTFDGASEKCKSCPDTIACRDAWLEALDEDF